MADEGILKIHLQEAHLTHDVQAIGKMDPYVKFTCREQEFKSTICKNGGKNPKWSHDTIEIQVHYLGDDLHFHVWDDEVGRDESIGQGSCKLSSLAIHGGFDEWFEIQHKGEPAGKIHLKAEWHPAHGLGHHHH